MITLRFSAIDSPLEISFNQFEDAVLASNYFMENSTQKDNIVYIFGIEKEGIDEVFITHNKIIGLRFLTAFIEEQNDTANIYIYEDESYEEAYKVALSMKETSELCYSKQ